jgi:hypothetical protein
MMGYQFFHVEGYARVGAKTKDGGTRHSIQQIVDEAERVQGNIPHIEHPEPPELLYGANPAEIVAMAENWAEQAKDAKGRKFRKDGLILLAGVASLPRERESDFNNFAKSTIKWLKKKYGSRLKSVIAHEKDEAHPHIHFYVIPKHGERFDDIHEGFKAANTAKVSGKLKGEQNQAYKEAMRGLQDEYCREVAMGLGLTRLGPSRRRLSRKAWMAEQKQAEFFADSKKVAEKGYQAGYKKGKERAKTKADEKAKEAEELGNKVGQFFSGLLGGLHQPTAEVLKAMADTEKKAEEEQKKRDSTIKNAKKEADQRVVRVATELQEIKRKNEYLDKEVENLAEQLKNAISIIQHHEAKNEAKAKLGLR